jgi:hypothetical protein
MWILLATIFTHLRKSREAHRMAELATVFDDLVKSVRFGRATDDEIRETVPPRDFPYFERFLQDTISTIDDIDVSAEKRIAGTSGFQDHVNERIGKSRGWDKVIAVRTLSYFRDRENIPLFQKIQEEKNSVQVLFSATMGIALCKEPSAMRFRTVGYKLWEMIDYNPVALWTAAHTYGAAIAPAVHEILRADELIDDGKRVFTMFLSECGYKEAVPTILEMLRVAESHSVKMACLNALGRLGDVGVVPDILPFMENEDVMLRVEAVHAVAGVGSEECIPHVERHLNDENWWVRREAASALVEMGVPGLIRLNAVAETGAEAPRATARAMLAELRFNRMGKGWSRAWA